MRTLENIARACGGVLNCADADRVIGRITVDSRECDENSLFIADNGEIVDNYCYTSDAVSRGAAVLGITETSDLKVASIEKAIIDIAKYCRSHDAGKVLAVTGSVGKTTVKELCASILKNSGKLSVKATDGNRNNLLGLPLTLMKPGRADVTVLEAGISEIGEMSKLSEIASPDVAVITCVGKMHAENFGTLEKTAEEKLKITEHMPENGIVMLPAGENLLCFNSGRKLRKITIGESKNADMRVFDIKNASGGTVFSVAFEEREYHGLYVPIVGRHGAIDAAFAIAACSVFGVSEKDIRGGLASYTPCGDRQKILKNGNTTVISDCYNAGPESVEAALNAFPRLCEEYGDAASVRAVLLCDMLELGDIAEHEHYIAGREAAESGADVLIFYGTSAESYAAGAYETGFPRENIYYFREDEAEGLFELLGKIKSSPSTVLVKGSRGMRAERFVDFLCMSDT